MRAGPGLVIIGLCGLLGGSIVAACSQSNAPAVVSSEPMIAGIADDEAAAVVVPDANLRNVVNIEHLRELAWLSDHEWVANENADNIIRIELEPPYRREVIATRKPLPANRDARSERGDYPFSAVSNLRAYRGSIAWLSGGLWSGDSPPMEVWTWSAQTGSKKLGTFRGPPGCEGDSLAIDDDNIYVARGWCEYSLISVRDNEVLAYSRSTGAVHAAAPKPGANAFAIDDSYIYRTIGMGSGSLERISKSDGTIESLLTYSEFHSFALVDNFLYADSFERPRYRIASSSDSDRTETAPQLLGHRVPAWGSGNIDDDGICWINESTLICRSRAGVRTEARVPANIGMVAVHGPQIALYDGQTIWLTDRPTTVVGEASSWQDEPVLPTPPDPRCRVLVKAYDVRFAGFLSHVAILVVDNSEFVSIDVRNGTRKTLVHAMSRGERGMPSISGGAFAWLEFPERPIKRGEIWLWTETEGAHRLATLVEPGGINDILNVDDDSISVLCGSGDDFMCVVARKTGAVSKVHRATPKVEPDAGRPEPPGGVDAGTYWGLIADDDLGRCWKLEDSIRCQNTQGDVGEFVFRSHQYYAQEIDGLHLVFTEGDYVLITDRPNTGVSLPDAGGEASQ